MQLKNTYSSREVAAMTGLTARQLQWWDSRRLFAPAIRSHRTPAGGFTERRYTPVDLLELMVLAELRRQGISVGRIRLLLDILRQQFGLRLFDAIGGGGWGPMGTSTLLASAVEFVEAFTIVLAMGITRGWRSASRATPARP